MTIDCKVYPISLFVSASAGEGESGSPTRTCANTRIDGASR
jgi:hypothetical protein